PASAGWFGGYRWTGSPPGQRCRRLQFRFGGSDMPQALAGYIVPILSHFFIGIGLPGLAFGATIGAIAPGASYLALAAGAYLISQAFQPPKPETPKPEDGKYNLKQTVPPLVYVLGKVKKAGDYAFLEEKGGTAYHITVWAAHSIKGFTRH